MLVHNLVAIVFIKVVIIVVHILIVDVGQFEDSWSGSVIIDIGRSDPRESVYEMERTNPRQPAPSVSLFGGWDSGNPSVGMTAFHHSLVCATASNHVSHTAAMLF